MADGLSKKLPSWTSDIEWPTAIPEKDRLRLKPEPVLESYLPTSRDRMLYALARFYGGDAKGEKGSARANETMNFLDWTPVGALNDSYDVGRMIGEGHLAMRPSLKLSRFCRVAANILSRKSDKAFPGSHCSDSERSLRAILHKAIPTGSPTRPKTMKYTIRQTSLSVLSIRTILTPPTP